MSKRKVQGVVIQFEGNTTPLKEALKDVDKASSKTTSELNKINGALKFDGGNTTLLAQKQEVLQDAIRNTTSRLDTLKQAQAEVDRMFANNEIDAASYREFRREIEITERKLNEFKSEANNVKAKLDIKVDTTALDKVKTKFKELPDEAKKAAKEISQVFGTGLTVAAGGMMALTVATQDTNKDLSRLESQANSTLSSVNKLGNNIQKMSDAEVEALENSLDEKESAIEKSYDKQLSTIEKSYDKQEKAFEKSLDNEMSALEKAHDRKLDLIDKEYKERLKLIDEDEYRRLKAIDAEIEGIEAEQDAIEKLNKIEADNAKRLELVDKVNNARTKYDKEQAAKELAKFDEKLIEERKAEERRANIETLKDEKDAIRESSDQKRDAVQSEYDLKVEQLNESFELERQSMQDLHDLKREQFAEQKEQYLTSVKEQFDEELKLYKEMNAKKVEVAKTPINNSGQSVDMKAKVNLDVSDFTNARVIFDSVGQEVDQASEAIGNLVRAGYESGEDLTKISKSLAGSIQQYGDNFNVESLAESIGTTTQLGEATGQLVDLLEKSGMTVEEFNAEIQQYSTVGERAQYISDLLAKQGLSNVYDEFAKARPEIIQQSEAYIEYVDAVDRLTTALLPLITAVTKVVTGFANFGAEHPIIAKSFVVLTTVIGGLLSVFGVLYPIIRTIVQLLPKLAKFLPWIARGFAVLTGPIGWIILAVTTLVQLVPLVIKHWGKISGFFKKLWDGVKFSFSTAVEGIKIIALAVVNVVKKPINGMIGLINDFLRGVNAIKIPEWVPAVGGRHFKIPEIPMLAKGTDYFRGGLAIVGEEGPEMVRMPMGTKVHTAKETASMLGGGGEITINVPLSIDGRVFANAVAKYTDRELYALKQRNERGR